MPEGARNPAPYSLFLFRRVERNARAGPTDAERVSLNAAKQMACVIRQRIVYNGIRDEQREVMT